MRHRSLTDAKLDEMVAKMPLKEILHAAANRERGAIDPWASLDAIDEQLYAFLVVPIERARRAVETMTKEPDKDIRALLVDVAREVPELRELALNKAGCPDMKFKYYHYFPAGPVV